MRALLLLTLVACERASGGPPPPPPPQMAPPAPHELVATMSRGPCYGTCAVYKLAIYRDGVVEYTGEEYVELRGPAIGHVSARQLARLDRMFADARFFDLADHYTNEEWTDMSSVTTTYQLGARAKQVEHYHGDSHAPQALERLEEDIDELVNVEQWIGTHDECEQHAQDWR